MEPKTGKITKSDDQPTTLLVATDEVYIKTGFNPRSEIGDVSGLRANIKQHGLINPITVCPRKQGGYWVICGERRLTALHEMKAPKILIKVMNLTIDSAQALALALSENSSGEDGLRQGLAPLDQAKAYDRLGAQLSDAGEASDAASIGKLSGCHGRTVKRLLSLLTLTKRTQKMVSEGTLSARAAITVAEEADAEIRERAEQAVQEGMTAENVKVILNDITRDKRRGLSTPASVDPDLDGEGTATKPNRKNLPKGQAPGTRVVARGMKEIRAKIQGVAVDFLNARAEGSDDDTVNAYANVLAALLWVVGILPEISAVSPEFQSAMQQLSEDLSTEGEGSAGEDEEGEGSAGEEGEDGEGEDEEDEEDEEGEEGEEGEDEEGEDEAEEGDEDEEDEAPPRKPKRGALGSDEDVEA